MENSKEYSYHVLDPTTPWYEFLSYQECCYSLQQPCSITRYIRYHEYLKSVGIK